MVFVNHVPEDEAAVALAAVQHRPSVADPDAVPPGVCFGDSLLVEAVESMRVCKDHPLEAFEQGSWAHFTHADQCCAARCIALVAHSAQGSCGSLDAGKLLRQ